MTEYMDELAWASRNGIISEEQFDIFEKRSKGWTYSSIVSDFKLSGDHAVITCLARTAQGKFWNPGYIDKIYFKDLLENCADNVNYVPTTVSIQLAFFLHKKRFKKAIYLLDHINCSCLIKHIKEPIIPSQSWIYEFAKSIDLKVLNP